MEAWRYGAAELLAMLARRELSSVEIVRSLGARRAEVERLNAFVVDLTESALRDAARADEARARGDARPLLGLPVTIKENIDVEGTDATLGARRRQHRPAKSDAVTVRLLRELGAIVIGKTNVPQTLISMETTNPIFGTTVNPWSAARVPGGSSGGEAAAIATGASVIGVGTDIGGSIRIPASFCGLAGIKPTLHRWSNRGSNGAIPGQEIVRSQMGPIARSVRDLTLLLRAVDPRRAAELDPEVPPLPISDPSALDVRELRVGFYDDDQYMTPAASVKRALREAREALEARGARVVPFDPPRANEHYALMVAAVTADGLRAVRELIGDDPVIDALKINYRMAQLPRAARKTLGRALRAMGEVRPSDGLLALGPLDVPAYHALAARRLDMQRRELDAWNDAGIDAILCPATATPAPLLGETGDFTPAASYTTRYNVLNLPAGVVPVTRVRSDETTRAQRFDRVDKKAARFEQGSEGLPIGVQIVARPWREDVALALMEAIEAAARERDGFPRTPIDPR